MESPAIKTKARTILREYNPDALVPFPFEALASSVGDVSLLFLDKMPSEISGAIFRQEQDPSRFTILINKQKPEVRQYFTTAHEFGHYFLHREWLSANTANGFVDYQESLDVEGMLLRPDRAPLNPEQIRQEREANAFAAELIMPEDKVREFWGLTHNATACADAFQVSQVAMTIRLQKLKLIP